MAIDHSMSEEIGARMHDAAKRFNVLGASLAIHEDGQLHEFATGTAHVKTGHPVTADHLFLIGSTTKTYTATLIMQLVQEGRCELDQPVKRYVPELTLADGVQEESLLVRHLLSHTSGIDSGPYDEHGRGDDAPARYVASLAPIPAIHPPGERFGYSNAAIVIAGRLIETLTERTWEDALYERLLKPAGLTASFTLPEDAIVHPVAVGHYRGPDRETLVSPTWGLCGRAMAPTGSTMCATAADLARYGAIHVNEGVALNGTRVLDAEAVGLMQEVQVSLPEGFVIADGWGLGWLWDDWPGGEAFGHTGHNYGAGSYLRFLPSERAVIALTFNSPGDSELMHELFSFLFCELWGITKPDPWVRIDPDFAPDLDKYTGTYERYGLKMRVTPAAGGLQITPEPGQPFTEGTLDACVLTPATRSAFGTTEATTYTVTPPSGAVAPDLIFEGFDGDGRPQYAYTAVFAARRTSN